MFGFIRKKYLIEKMREVKDSNRFETLYGKYPAKTEDQKLKNCYSQGYEDGTDNFYNALKSFIKA